MARPLDYTVRPASPEERLAEARADSLPALEESLKLLRELHTHGVLDTLVKLTRGGAGLTAKGLETLEDDGVLRGIRNVVAVGQLLGNIDPAETERLSGALQEGLREGARRVAQGERASLPELLLALRDPDVSLALGALLGLLKGLGRGLRDG